MSRATTEPPAQPPTTRTNPGPVYDNALCLLARRDLATICAWLGIPTRPDTIDRGEALPAATLHADLIAETTPGHLAHVEFVRTPGNDMTRRMLDYRARIMTLHPHHTLTQHVVVLAQGTVPPLLHDGQELTLHLHITYLRDQDPTTLLTDPALAPLAVLAHATNHSARVENLRHALTVINTVDDDHHRHDLVHTTATLAGIHLDPVTIEQLTKEAGMPFTLDEDTVAGRIIAATAEARGLARGEARGLARGEAQGEARERVQTYTALLTRTFGDDPRIPTLAQHLADLPREQALDAALTATTLDDLLTLTPDRPGSTDPTP